MTNAACALDPIPLSRPHPSLFVPISIPICSRISYLYKRKQHRQSSDSVTTSCLNFTAKFLALPMLVSPLSRRPLSSARCLGLLPTPSSQVGLAPSVRVRLAAQGELCPSSWPVTGTGRGGSPLSEITALLASVTLASLTDLLRLFDSLFSLCNL